MTTDHRNRQPKGVSTGGQFVSEARSEASGVKLAAQPAEPVSELRSKLADLHRRIMESGELSPERATGFMVGTAAKKMADQAIIQGQNAANAGQEGAALGYIQSHGAMMTVLKSAAKEPSDPQDLRNSIAEAKTTLRSGAEMFRGFGPNNVTLVTDETANFLDDLDGFVTEIHP